MGCGASTQTPPTGGDVTYTKPTGPLPENSCKHLLPKMETSKPKWSELMKKAKQPAKGSSISLMFIADQDQASKVEGGWETKLACGTLTYNGDKGPDSYTLTRGKEVTLVTSRGDKSDRGAEYSALEIFDGRLLTMCDRTGFCDEVAITSDGGLEIKPLEDKDGKPVMFPLGDGSKAKPLKVEWASHKGGKLIVGSTGKVSAPPRTLSLSLGAHDSRPSIYYRDSVNKLQTVSINCTCCTRYYDL